MMAATTVIRYTITDDGFYEFNIGGALTYKADADVFLKWAGSGEYTMGKVLLDADKAQKLCHASEIVGLIDGWEIV